MGEQPDEEMITGYLLGTVSEAESERLDELSLTDDDFAERLRAAENDLVDSYVKGELSGDLRARFISHYLASPRRLEKVRLAEALVAYADTQAAATAEHPGAPDSVSVAVGEALPRERFRFGIPGLPLQWGFAVAALLLLLTAGYLAFHNIRLRNQVAQERAERAELEHREQELQQQLDERQSAGAETEKELAQVRDRLSQLEQQLGAPQQRNLNVVAFNLSAQTRGVGNLATLTVPRGTDLVALQLHLEADDFPAYRAALKDPLTGQIVWRSGELKKSGKSKALRVSLRAGLLRPQNYSIELSGIASGGTVESLGSYPFRVATQ
ncbi:MAG TPA: hypothetical protein VKF81_05885 [Blastocatellia bacterium]|nr:hypothetical protein [Blastocatellia bacterium]